MDAEGGVVAREIEGMELHHGVHIEDARCMYSRQDGIDSMVRRRSGPIWLSAGSWSSLLS